MPDTANERLRDDIIEHDVRLRRLVANEQKDVTARQRQLERGIIVLLQEIDPLGITGEKRQQARLKKLQDRIVLLAREIYGEHNSEMNQVLRQLVVVESEAVTGLIEDVGEIIE